MFIFESLFWTALSVVLYHNLLFRCLGSAGYNESRTIFWVLEGGSFLMGILITLKERRNNLSLYVNIVFPLVVYAAFTYHRNFPYFLLICGCVGLALALTYAVALLSHTIANRARKWRILRRRLVRTSLGVRTIVTCCLSVFVLYLGCRVMIGAYLFSPSVEAEDHREGKVTIAANIKTVAQLEAKTWVTLTQEEKLNTLQVVANIEASYLGLPNALPVRVSALREGTLASYDQQKRLILIDVDHFDSDPADEILDSVCHEAYHAYQHCLCEAYDSVDAEFRGLMAFEGIPEYKAEFADYSHGDDDFYAYYFQRCETDARSYAADAVYDYYRKISNYLAQSAS